MAARAESPRVLSLAVIAFLIIVLAQLGCRQPSAVTQEEAFVGDTSSHRQLRSRASIVGLRAEATAETFAKVSNVVVDQLSVEKDKISRTATLSELGADSLDIVETVMALETEFDVELPDEETTKLKNLGDVADLIQSKLDK
uniref:Acyl carrier protein n=1 Tax=Polykrikos lebourae TaxID=370573 RepID=A0A0K0TN09_9DINO|nr:chloroplast acyl carrier protein [Polykrikos lebourae]